MAAIKGGLLKTEQCSKLMLRDKFQTEAAAPAPAPAPAATATAAAAATRTESEAFLVSCQTRGRRE